MGRQPKQKIYKLIQNDHPRFIKGMGMDGCVQAKVAQFSHHDGKF